MAGKPKPGFYIIVLLVIAGLVGFAFWRYSKSGDDKNEETPDNIKTRTQGSAEDPSGQAITTVKEYEFEPAAKLPDIKGAAAYQKLDAKRTVKFAINVWAGWAPIIYANRGFKPGQVWKDGQGKEFLVELKLIDNPVNMRDVFAAGEIHIGWATVDMLPLLLEGLQKDSRTMPRIFQQIDWSNGGDGIVVRKEIKDIGGLRGKKVVLAQNSPSHFFLLNALLNGGVQPAEVDMEFAKDAFQAAAAFNNSDDFAAVVTWAPDIYTLSEQKKNKMLVTTGTANKLIGDVWYARADFSKENPEIIEGLVRGIFDAMIDLQAADKKTEVAKLMAEGYSMKADEALGMLADAHWTNYAENREFFLNQNNPTNFENTYKNAVYLYKQIGQVSNPVPFDQIVDFSVLKKLGKIDKYASQKDEYTVKFTPASSGSIQQAAESEILTKTVVIQFAPNSHQLDLKVERNVGGKKVSELYDPKGPLIVEEIGRLAAQYGAARIVIEGHTDASMKGRVDPSLVKELSTNRANAVKEAVVRKYPSLQPNQFAAAGMGWERPADADDPQNHAKNRRVEIKVYPAEIQ
jgi:NitT/TauT family transport system substrate-binding protein